MTGAAFVSYSCDHLEHGNCSLGPPRRGMREVCHCPCHDVDVAEPQPGSEGLSGDAVCHHCGGPIRRAGGASVDVDWLHITTQRAECPEPQQREVEP